MATFWGIRRLTPVSPEARGASCWDGALSWSLPSPCRRAHHPNLKTANWEGYVLGTVQVQVKKPRRSFNGGWGSPLEVPLPVSSAQRLDVPAISSALGSRLALRKVGTWFRQMLKSNGSYGYTPVGRTAAQKAVMDAHKQSMFVLGIGLLLIFIVLILAFCYTWYSTEVPPTCTAQLSLYFWLAGISNFFLAVLLVIGMYLMQGMMPLGQKPVGCSRGVGVRVPFRSGKWPSQEEREKERERERERERETKRERERESGPCMRASLIILGEGH